MYSHKLLNDDTTLILDEQNEAMYLIEGSECALLIDTGFEKEDLNAYVKTLTDKPVKVVLTHGHIDHIAQTYLFDEVYISPLDFPVYIAMLEKATEMNLSVKAPSDLLEMPAFFDLGNKDILVLPTSGHTRGSVLLIDASNKSIYTGDAIGSGCGVWMQLDESSDMLSYKASLENTVKSLERIGVDDSWTFLGGHYGQDKQSKVSDYNPLCLNLIKDMMDLCDELVLGHIEYQDTNEQSFSHTPYYVSHKTAEMIVTKQKVNKLS